MSPEKKKYSFELVRMVVLIVVSGLTTWYTTKLSIESKFAEIKEELHVFIAEEKAINNVSSSDIDNLKADYKSQNNLVNELDKKVFALMTLYKKQIKKDEE